MSVNDNIKLVRRITESFDAGDTSSWDEFFTPDVAAYNLPEGFSKDREGLERLTAALNSGVPDGKTEVLDVFGADDRVCARLRSRGTHTGELLGVPPSGNAIDVEGIEIYRFEGGKVAEYWTQWDMLSMLRQVGAMPS